MSKPFHSSQKTLEKHIDYSVTIEITVHLNFELERMILGFGDAIEVFYPKELRRSIKRKLSVAMRNYGDLGTIKKHN